LRLAAGLFPPAHTYILLCVFLCIYPLSTHAQIIDDQYIIADQQKQRRGTQAGDAMRRRAEESGDFFAGLELAKRAAYDYVDPKGAGTSWPAFEGSHTTWLFGFNLRKYFGGNFGLGMELLFMHANTERAPFSAPPGTLHYFEATFTPFLIDFDLLFRVPLLQRLLLNFGAGFTFECMFYKVREYSGSSKEVLDRGSVGSQPGYSLKIGIEFFLDAQERWSVTLDSKLQRWKSGFGQEKFTINTVGAGLAYRI
jgi:hypothetical protein